MYKIENITSDIKLIHPKNIPKRFFINDETVKISGIILNKPYKLQITAIAKFNGKKKKRKKVLEYEGTLNEAVIDATAKRTIWSQELKTELKTYTITHIDKVRNTIVSLESEIDDLIANMQVSSPDMIPVLAITLADKTRSLEQEKQQLEKLEVEANQDGSITEMLTLNEAFELYIKAQIIKFKSKKVPREYDEYRYRGVYDKHIRNVIGARLLENIDKEDIQEITNNMIVSSRAKIDKDGNKIPLLDEDGKQMRYRVKKTRNGKVTYGNHGALRYEMEAKPATERTKRTIYQLVNPIYTYVNNSNKIKYTVSSPATLDGLEPLDNERKVTENIDTFTKLYNYSHQYYQKIFVWLMHGRRLGEVTSLEYEDIDMEEGTYTIQAKNNKAKVDMTYILTQWQKDTLDVISESGLVFPSINNSSKKISSGTILSNHWKLNCTIHDLRHIIGNTLVNNDVSIEVIGRILGHKPKKNVITNRYAKVTADKANMALSAMLKEVLIIK